MSFKENFNSLQNEVHDIAVRNGFWEEPNFGEKVALVHSEVSEILEAARKPSQDDKLPQFTGVEVEAADVIIRLMDMAGAYGWNLSEAIEQKVAYNKTRPYKHGKLF